MSTLERHLRWIQNRAKTRLEAAQFRTIAIMSGRRNPTERRIKNQTKPAPNNVRSRWIEKFPSLLNTAGNSIPAEEEAADIRSDTDTVHGDTASAAATAEERWKPAAVLPER